MHASSKLKLKLNGVISFGHTVQNLKSGYIQYLMKLLGLIKRVLLSVFFIAK
jgi:hypothetical protein